MMIKYPIITLYLARLFTKQFCLSVLTVICILLISNIFDNLQKFKSNIVSASDFWLLIFFKIPHLFNEVCSLVSFFATILFIQAIRKNNELIIFLSNGIPIGKIFMIPAILTFVFGIILLVIVNPLSTYGLKKYEKLESKITENNNVNIIISQSGIFFYDKYGDTNRIMQAKSINTSKNSFDELTILIVDTKNNLLQRIDAPTADLNSGFFKLNNPIITNLQSSEKLSEINLPTNLTVNNLMMRFSPPEMINIWQLSDSIIQFSKSGLAVIKYQLYYYKQLFKPLTMLAMSSIACWFVSVNLRNNSNTIIVAVSLILGLCTYFFLELTFRALAYNNFSPQFAIFLPIIFIILISNFVILHFQEA